MKIGNHIDIPEPVRRLVNKCIHREATSNGGHQSTWCSDFVKNLWSLASSLQSDSNTCQSACAAIRSDTQAVLDTLIQKAESEAGNFTLNSDQLFIAAVVLGVICLILFVVATVEICCHCGSTHAKIPKDTESTPQTDVNHNTVEQEPLLLQPSSFTTAST